jgi:hypothetical protein
MVLWSRVVRETFGKKPDFSGAWITRVKVRDWASFAFFILPFFYLFKHAFMIFRFYNGK